MRAIAILWVIFYHGSVLPFFTTSFFLCILKKAPYLAFITNGDMGVDMFFVLSGFLIGYVLQKELNKYGSIDYKHFLLSRVFRIWPALFLYQLIKACFEISDPWWGVLTPLLFVQNFTGPFDHLWSIAVEFQFYLFSPFLVKWVHRSPRPWLLPLGIFAVSTAYNVITMSRYCPESWTDSSVWRNPESQCFRYYLPFNYEQVIARMSPYGFGIYAAYKHDKGS